MHQTQPLGRTGTLVLVSLAVLMIIPGCGGILLNSVASLGGTNPGGRGAVDIVFDNQTPYRAIFTVGVYDPQDQNSEVLEYVQFAVDADEAESAFNRGLPPQTLTERGSLPLPCARVVSLGGAEMLARIDSLDESPSNGAPIIEAALRTGIYFSDKPLDDPDANAEQNPVAQIGAVDSLLGLDFECSGSDTQFNVLIYRFTLDPNDATNVLVTLDVIPADVIDSPADVR